MKALRTAVIVVGAAALVASGVGALAGAGLIGTGLGSAATFLGVSAGTWGAIGAIGATVAAVGGALTAGRPSFGGGGSPTDFTTNPQSGLPYAIGRTRMSGLKIDGKTSATPGWTSTHDLVWFAALLSIAGPVQAIESFTADNVAVTFDPTTGNATSGEYVNWMAQKVYLGAPSQATGLSLSLNGGSFPGWPRKLSGMAHALWGLRHDSDGKHYSGGVPEPSWVGRWVKVYDPRKDSTYPGGSGSHRSDDEATWEWSRNPALHALTWAIGRTQNGKRICGIGAPIASIRVADFVEAANVADANGWGCGGVEWTTDSKWDIFKRMLQAGGAVPTKTGAMIGCRVKTPRVSLGTIQEADFLDGITYVATKGRRNRFNTVVPRYVSEAHNWQVIAGSEIGVPAYVTADGGKRTKGIDFPLVQDEIGQAGFDGKKQAGQLAAYEIVDSREASVEFTTKPKWIGLRTGDCVTLNSPQDDIVNMKVVITSRTVDPATMTIRFTAETETDSKHAFALGQTSTPPPAPTLSVPAGRPAVPGPGAWTVSAVDISNGLPGLRVSGAIDDLIADRVLVQYRRSGTLEWIVAPDIIGTGPKNLDIGPLDRLADWDVRLAYRAGDQTGDWLEITNAATGENTIGDVITAQDTQNVGGVPSTTIVSNINDLMSSTIGAVTSGDLSRPSYQVFAYADGTVPSWAGVGGVFRVRSGGVDVTADATFSATASVGVTGGIDASGNYSVTGMTVDSGILTLTATYDGHVITQVFSVSKLKTGYEIVGTLPTTNLFEGRMAFLTSDGKLYRYHAGAWTASVAAPDISGQLIASQIEDGAISIAKFASGLQPVVIWSGASLPTTNQGNALFWTVNGKLYRWGGSAYTASVAAADISGTIADAQIAGLAASKVTGTLTDSQLASISAAKVTGQIVAGQITDGALTAAKFAASIEPVTIVSSVPTTLSTRAVFNTSDGKMYRWNVSAYVATVPTSDLAGTIADAQLSAISATKITGTITSTQIADGSISTPKLAAGSITAGKIAAGTITASEIAAGTITGDRMAANTITSSQIAADTITAGNIAAGAIGASEIAAGAVTAGKMVIADMENLAINGDFASGLDYWDKRLTKSGANVIEIQTDGSGWPSKNALFMRRALSSDSSELSVTNGSTNFNTDTALAGGFPIRPDDEVLFEAVAYALNGARPTVDLIVRDRNGTISSYAISWIEQLTTNSAFTRISGVLKNLSSVEGKAWIRVRSINATANNADLYWWNIRSKRRASGSLIVDGGITALKIAAGTITSTQIAADTITAANIAAGAITATELATGSVTAGKIAAGSIQALDIAAGTITGDRLAANTITSTQIAADTITAGQIAAGAIGASEIAAGAVTTNKLAVVPESILPDAYFRDSSTWQAPLDAGGWFFEQNTGSGGSINPYSMGVPSCITLEAQPAGTRKHAWGPYVPYSGSGQVVRLRGQGLNSGPDWIYYKILFVRDDLTEAGSVTIGFPPFSNVSAQSAQASVPNGTAYYRAVAFNAADVSDGTSRSISAVKLDVAASAEMIVDGSITAAKIVAGSITGDRLAANTITAGNIASEQITADKLAVGAVTAGKIAANAVTALTIAVDTITANKFVTNEGVDLAALVPGTTLTSVAAAQSGSAFLSPSTPNYNLETAQLPVGNSADLILIGLDYTITGRSGGAYNLYLMRKVNGGSDTIVMRIQANGGGGVGAGGGNGSFVGTQHLDFQDAAGHPTGNLSYYLALQLSSATTVDYTGFKLSFSRLAAK